MALGGRYGQAGGRAHAAEGHQAIGEAARTMLSSKARGEIQKLLGNDDLASIAVWLDDVRNWRITTAVH